MSYDIKTTKGPGGSSDGPQQAGGGQGGRHFRLYIAGLPGGPGVSGGVIDLCHSCGETIEKITADRPEYAAMAAIMTVICHPVPNRDIQDFE